MDVTRCLPIAVLAAACGPRPPTVPGPEATDLVRRAAGTLVWSGPGGEIRALALPSLRESVVRAAAPANATDVPIVHALSGPDAEGRIAYIEDHFHVPDAKERRHLLKTIRTDGTDDQAVFAPRAGDAMWAHSFSGAIGEALALAPTRGLVAFVSGLEPRQMPRALFYEGTVEIWDVAQKTRLDTKVTAVDAPMSWSPDGRRLLHVRFVPRAELPAQAAGTQRLGEYGSWSALPAVFVLDLDSGESRFVHVGSRSIVAPDGKTALVGWWAAGELAWSRVDLATGRASPARWPGDQGAIAVTATDLVLYLGLPTAGAPIEYSHSGTRGPQPLMTVKVAEIDSPRFETVIPRFDRRTRVSFGR